MIKKIRLEGKRRDGAQYCATGEYDDQSNKLTIFKDSYWAPGVTQNNVKAGKAIQKDRDELIGDGTVTGNKFNRDKLIEAQKNGGTPITKSAQIIIGTTTAVDDAWKIEPTNESLFDYLEKEGVVAGEKSRRYIKPENRSSIKNEGESIILENAEKSDKEITETESLDPLEEYRSQNVIFYGVPGCGKSFEIDKILKHMSIQYKRILFHPEYTYSDFVGQIKPVAQSGNISYEFVAGPFAEILKEALRNEKRDYILVIEEINRGNAPAIFGDLFQLLDRSDSGASEYNIYNKDILGYLNRDLQDNEKYDSVKLPKNLTILATMNTCDQNVFTLDTAFKRRWRMRRIKNDFHSVDIGNISLNNDIVFSWTEFAKAVNDAILNNCNDGTAAEDKQLGAYFVKKADLKSAERFAQKVLMYLWDDVAKYDKSQLFDTTKCRTLDELLDKFVKGENVFSPNCAMLKELYERKEPTDTPESNKAAVDDNTEGQAEE